MKSFSNFISEAFDKPYPFKLKKENDRSYTSGVRLPDYTYLDIIITKSQGQWEVIFRRDDSIEVTGGGDAMRILSTVLAATKQFIEMEDPAFVRFTAAKTKEQQSRSNLYKRMVNRFAKQMGYDSETVEISTKTMFLLSKKGSSNTDNMSAADMMRRRQQR